MQSVYRVRIYGNPNLMGILKLSGRFFVPRDQAGLDCPEVEACGAGLLRGQDVRSETAPGTAVRTRAMRPSGPDKCHHKRAQAGIVVTLPQWLGSTEEATVPHTVDLYRDSELPC